LNSLLASDDSVVAAEGTLPAEALPEPRSQGKLVLRKFLRHKLAMLSTAVLVLIVLVCLIMPIFWPHNFEDSSNPSFAAPSADFRWAPPRSARTWCRRSCAAPSTHS
jgi:peptide/nickel transport system permease protein